MSTTSPLRVAVFGVGAVGGYFGGALARAGHHVTFIARGGTAAALREHGLRVESGAGDFRISPARVAEDPAAVGPVDIVLLGVKAWQVAEVAPHLGPLLATSSAVIPLQNGVEAADELAAALGPAHVLGGLCKIICLQVGPAHLKHVGAEPWIGFGELDNRASARADAWRQAFEEAGVRAEVPDDIHVAIWSKFLFIASLSGVGAVARATIGAMRGEPRTRRLLIDVMTEVETLARHLQIALPDDIVAKTMEFTDGLPADGTSSMQRDIADGRPSEIESQIGAVVRLAEQADLDLPVSRAVYTALRSL